VKSPGVVDSDDVSGRDTPKALLQAGSQAMTYSIYMFSPRLRNMTIQGQGEKSRVLLLAPSDGLGGGVERYLANVEECLRNGGADVRRLNLLVGGASPGRQARARFTCRAIRHARYSGPFNVVLTGHPNLMPVAVAATTAAAAPRAPVIFHGTDIFRLPTTYRAVLARHPALFPITVSTFSAGALAGVGAGQAPVLRPGLRTEWRTMLLTAAQQRCPASPPTLLSVFRLNYAGWEGKGLRELLLALQAVRHRVGPVRLVIAGQGPVQDPIRRLVADQQGVELRASPDDAALAQLYAAADVFVLCTRTQPGRSGEGYGMVLTEAQLAGCAVVAPVSGGSRDAYVDGVTGTSPRDESPEALAAVLTDLLSDPARLAGMQQRAAEWARLVTRPEEHARAVLDQILGTNPGNQYNSMARRPISQTEPAASPFVSAESSV